MSREGENNGNPSDKGKRTSEHESDMRNRLCVHQQFGLENYANLGYR